MTIDTWISLKSRRPYKTTHRLVGPILSKCFQVGLSLADDGLDMGHRLVDGRLRPANQLAHKPVRITLEGSPDVPHWAGSRLQAIRSDVHGHPIFHHVDGETDGHV